MVTFNFDNEIKGFMEEDDNNNYVGKEAENKFNSAQNEAIGYLK